MAITQTSTLTSGNVILNEVLNDKILGALTPKVVFWNLMNHDSIDGAASLAKEYPKYADYGPAIAGTEAVDFTTTTTISYDTTVTVTPTEAAMARADITTRAIRRKAPGMSADAVFGPILSGDFSGILDILAEEAGQLARMCFEKAEVDCCALLDDYSDSVGSTGVDITLANVLTAIYKLEENEPEHENFAWVMHPQQMFDIRTFLLAQAAGNVTAGVWNQQADANFINFQGDAPRNGLKGSLLGIPVYQTSPSVNPLPNAGADVAGALVCVGQGAPGSGMRAANVFLEGMPMRFLVDVDPSARTIELLCLWEYAVAEHTDAHGVSIITDAP